MTLSASRPHRQAKPGPFIYRLVYRSRSLIPHGHTGERELAALASAARINNVNLGVTGVLYHDRHYFMQLLEGAPQRVMEMFAIIQSDLRHSHVTVLSRTMHPNRAFSGWAMALVGDAELSEALGSAHDIIASDSDSFAAVMRSVLALEE